MKQFTTLLKNPLLALSVLFVTATFVLAAPPGTPYTVNETLDPSCAPWDTNCIVQLANGSDNLWNHTMTGNLLTNGNWISNDWGNEWVFVDTNGNVWIWTDTPQKRLHIVWWDWVVSGTNYANIGIRDQIIIENNGIWNLSFIWPDGVWDSGIKFYKDTNTFNNVAMIRYNRSSNNLFFTSDHWSNQNQMVLTSSWNLGIWYIPDQKFHVIHNLSWWIPLSTGSSTDPNVITRFSSNGWAALDFWMLADGTSWIQSRISTDFSNNRPLLLQPNGNNVGIGTISPSAKLHVLWWQITAERTDWADSTIHAKTNSGNVAQVALQNLSWWYFWLRAWSSSGSNSDFSIDDLTSNSRRLTISSSWNVGIWTASPWAILDVRGNEVWFSNNTSTMKFTNASNRNEIYFASSGSTNDFSIRNMWGMLSILDRPGTWPAVFNITQWTGWIWWNVGIGTTTPSKKLELLSSTSWPASYQLFLNTSLLGGYWDGIGFGVVAPSWNYVAAVINSENTNWWANDWGRLKFFTANEDASHTITERMRIIGNGNVGIGTTTPGEKLEVNGYGKFSSSIKIPGAWASSTWYYACIDGTTGEIYKWGGACTLSDRRLKRDIVNLESSNSLEKVLWLQGVAFKWKESFRGNATNIWFIAQDVEKLFPEAVTENPDGMKAMNYEFIIAPLVEAVKELYNKLTSNDEDIATLKKVIELQQEQIKSQQSQIDELKSRIN
jgi:hypothetical protein